MTVPLAAEAATAGETAVAGTAASGGVKAVKTARPSSARKPSSSSTRRKSSSTRKSSSSSNAQPANSSGHSPLVKGPARARKFWGIGKKHPAGRRVLVMEFVVCALIIALSPVTDRHKTDSMAALMKRASAVAALFLVLGLVSTGGRGAAKMANAFGGLVLVVLLISDRDVFLKLAKKFNADANASPAGPPDDEQGFLKALDPNSSSGSEGFGQVPAGDMVQGVIRQLGPVQGLGPAGREGLGSA